MTGTCQAPPRDSLITDEATCGHTATRIVLIACRHHNTSVLVCESCYADMAADAGNCAPCRMDGHDCPVLITDLTELETP